MACFPIAMAADGGIEILLITSKERGRWVIPKGNPIPFMLNYESAAREAFEEAGVEGPIALEPVGSYRYDKSRRSGGAAPAIVTVYPLQVTREAADWPERGERSRQWFPQAEAADGGGGSRSLRVTILSFTLGKDGPNPRTSLVVMGVNRLSWGYRMLKLIRTIMPREDRFFDMFERHAQILVAGARGDGQDALGRSSRSPKSCDADRHARKCRRRRHPRRAGRGAPLVHHARSTAARSPR